jgi:hypothetical protein
MSWLFVAVAGIVVVGLLILYIKTSKDDVFRYSFKCICGYHKGVLKCPYCSEDMR